MAERVSVDDFLRTQRVAPVKAVVEAADGNSVRVTPWSPGSCNCHLAVEIPRTAVSSVTPLDEVHECCGELHRVGMVEFAPAVSELILSIISQLRSRESRPKCEPLRDLCRKGVQWACDDYNDCLREGY
jgi:hypothetical protein